MILTKEKLESIRKKDFKIHCLKVKIWQNNGLSMEGHGTININKKGTLYVEFICTKNNININENNYDTLTPSFPLDNYNDEEKLHAEFTSLDGDIFQTEGFSLKVFLLHVNTNQIITFALSYIINMERSECEFKRDFMHYEFFESVDIHHNVMNKATSTQGEESMSWDETKIELDNFTTRIINEKSYTSVKVLGDFKHAVIMDCLNFYIGFSCGILPQPYLIITHSGMEKTIKIVSINNELSRKRSSNPIPSSVMLNNKADGEHSFNLFKKILDLRLNEFKRFNTLRAQWKRVWEGFTSSQEICELVLSVAVEGILNDIFIPIFNENRQDVLLNNKIESIKKEIDKLNLSLNDLSKLKSSVSYWKTITAAKALDILMKEGVINENDKKTWQKVRNDAAHPKIREVNADLMKRKRDELIKCIDIFHKLSLNVIGYSGPLIIFSENKREAIYINHKILI